MALLAKPPIAKPAAAKAPALAGKPPALAAGGKAPPAAAIPGLCKVATDLANLLERETGLIRAMKLTEIGPLQADKARLTQMCGLALKDIDMTAPVAKPLKEQWQAASKKLGDAALANEMALRVGRDATDKLVSAIVGHIQRRRNATSAYARPKRAAPGVVRRPSLSGVTLDRHL